MLKILCNLCSLGKCFSTKFKNLLPTLVLTILLNIELNQIIFLLLCSLLVLFSILSTFGSLKRKCFGNILLLELNNLWFELFTVKCLNTIMFKQLTKTDTLIKLYQETMILRDILYSPEDERHRETQSWELCSLVFH